MSDSLQTRSVTGASPARVTGVRLLGPITLVRADGADLELPSATQRRLLALLALHVGRPVRSELLGDVLGLGAGALRKVVSRLRSVVGEALQTSAIGYQIDLAVDAEQFTRVVRSPTSLADRTDALAEALGWWHGPALDEFAAEPWAMAEVARLEALRNAAVEELSATWIDTGRGAEAIVLLEPHVARHPLADAPQALLLRALASVGRHTEALRTAHRYRIDLRDVAGLGPGQVFVDVEHRVAGGWDGLTSPTTPVLAPASHLPTPTTRRVGPDALLDSIVADLAVNRVITLTGPGGVGKTRASLDAAQRAGARFGEGIVMVDLAPLGDPAAVPDAVASSLGAATRAGLSVTASIVERLSGSRLLLVLDNCEHVVQAAAELVRHVVAGCPQVTVLTTSREPLGMRGERVVTIRPLALDDAVDLFCERARAIDDATFTGDEHLAVEAICRRLDGLPLAVELAAARVRSIAPSDLLARLDRRFEVLGSARDGQRHQRTLWTTIDWSYQLLDPDEQHLFDELSVFHGSFDLDAVERVCTGPRAGSIGSTLAGLVDKSMIVTERVDRGLHYRLLDTLRQFADARLAERHGADDAGRRHAEHYVTVAEAAGRAWLGPQQLAADAVFVRVWDNLRAAHAWADDHGDQALAERLLLASIGHSHSRMRSEHGAWCSASIEAVDARNGEPSATLLGWGAWWQMIGGDLPAAIERAARGLERDAPAHDTGAAICRSVLVFALWSSGRSADAADAIAHLTPALDHLPPWEAYTGHRALFAFSSADDFVERAARIASITEAIGSPSLIASARFYQGTAMISGGGHAADAAAFHREGIDLAREAGAELAECQNLQGLLDAEVLLESPDARNVCLEAIDRLYELRYWLYLWRVLDGAACVIARAGRTEEAGLLLGHLDHVAAPWRTRPRSITRAIVSDAGVSDAVLANGAALDRDAGVELALRTLTDLTS